MKATIPAALALAIGLSSAPSQAGQMFKQTLRAEEAGVSSTVQFNGDWHVDVDASWSKAGPTGSQAAFGGASRVLTLNLTYDTSERKQSVLDQWVLPLGKIATVVPGLSRPPMVTFAHGAFRFSGVASRFSYKITRMAEDGTPLRAEVTVVIREASSAQVAVAAH
jgi:hypothetical protein